MINVSFRRYVFLYLIFQGGGSIGQFDPGTGIEAKALEECLFLYLKTGEKMRNEARYERV